MSATRNRLILGLALAVFAGSGGLVAWKLWPKPQPVAVQPAFPVAPAPEVVAAPGHISTIIDLPGDPVILRRAAVAAPRELHFALPVSLAPAAPKADALGYFIAAPLVSTTGGYMGKYTESGEEADALAFQLAYNAAQMQGGADAAPDDDGGDQTPQDAKAQWLTSDNSNQLEISVGERPATLQAIIKTVIGEKISDVLAANGFSADSAKAIEAAAKSTFNVQTLPPGSAALAYGSLNGAGGYDVEQFSIWENHEYVGAVGRLESGPYGQAARPKAPEGLLDDAAPALAPARYVLADGLYSAGLRNGTPESVIREAIQLIGRIADLKAPLPADETFRLLYSHDVRTRGKAGGHVAYVGLAGSAGPYDCYAFESGGGAYACYDPKAGSGPTAGGPTLKLGASGATATGGILAPIKGAPITSLFGMRFHPILKILRLHGGIDFGVAVGSPVRAAADGKVEIAGPVSGFGNHIRIQHDGFETSYSHLSEIPDAIKPGVAVKQGDFIALSGNTGLSTGPHLHFEYYENRTVVDPLPHLGTEAQASAAALAGASAPIAIVASGRPSDAESSAFPTFKSGVDAVLAAAAR